MPVVDIALQIVVPKLPGKAWKRQLPFRGDEGLFEDEFVEDRRKGLEEFINKCVLTLCEPYCEKVKSEKM